MTTNTSEKIYVTFIIYPYPGHEMLFLTKEGGRSETLQNQLIKRLLSNWLIGQSGWKHN